MSHNDAHITDTLDLTEIFHFVLWKQMEWCVDHFGFSCTTCYKHVHCFHGRLLGMVLDDKIKVLNSHEIAEPSLRTGRVMVRGTAGQKRKLILQSIAADKKKHVKKFRTLHMEGPMVSMPSRR